MIKKTKKLSQFHKAKSLLELKLFVKWDYEQLLRQVFLCLGGGKKNLNSFLKYCSVHSEKLHKMKFEKNIFFFLLNLIIQFKMELSPQIILNGPLLCIHFGWHEFSWRDLLSFLGHCLKSNDLVPRQHKVDLLIKQRSVTRHIRVGIIRKCHSTLVTPQSQNYLDLEAVEEGDLTPNFLLPWQEFHCR